MRRALLTLTLAGTLVAPASALASSSHATPCRTSQPGFVSYLGALNTTCATARTVERYWTGHEMLAPAWIAGVRWHVAWGTSTQTSIVAGGRDVYIVHRPSN